MTCPACRELLDVSGAKPRQLRKQTDSALRKFADAPLKVGMRATLRGVKLEIVGVIERHEDGYSWFEYCLFDGSGRDYWLWVYGGHTSLSIPDAEAPDAATPAALYRFRGRALRLFQTGKPQFGAALGVFPDAIEPARRTRCDDFVGAPYAASREGDRWTVFEYLDPADVAKAFGIGPRPTRGVGINQPSVMQLQRRAIGAVLLTALFVVAGLHVFTESRTRSTLLTSGAVMLDGPDSGPQSLPGFELSHAWNALDIRVRAPVNNAWADVELGLVDEATGKAFWTSHGVEYYSGRDEDGFWSEGSSTARTIVRSIPTGRYAVVARPSSGTWLDGRQTHEMNVEVREAGVPLGNTVLALALLLLFPGALVLAAHLRERDRWVESPFDPYSREEDE